MVRRIETARAILALIFIIAGFSVLIFFFAFIPFSPSDMLTIWLWSLLPSSMFGIAILILLNVRLEVKKVAGGIIFILLYSLIFFVPLPFEIRELVWGAWLLFLFLLIWGYKKYQDTKRKNMRKA